MTCSWSWPGTWTNCHARRWGNSFHGSHCFFLAGRPSLAQASCVFLGPLHNHQLSYVYPCGPRPPVCVMLCGQFSMKGPCCHVVQLRHGRVGSKPIGHGYCAVCRSQTAPGLATRGLGMARMGCTHYLACLMTSAFLGGVAWSQRSHRSSIARSQGQSCRNRRIVQPSAPRLMW